MTLHIRLVQETSHRQRRFTGPEQREQRELLGYRFPAGDSGSIAIERERADTLSYVDRGIVAMLTLDKQRTHIVPDGLPARRRKYHQPAVTPTKPDQIFGSASSACSPSCVDGFAGGRTTNGTPNLSAILRRDVYAVFRRFGGIFVI